jgi:phosphoribosyl-dephospho-CoA transferase
MPLAPAQGKLRVALEVAPRWIVRWAAPPTLEEVRERVRAPWRGRLDALAHAAKSIDTEMRVYGSCLWEALTGMPYLGAESDLDLLWQPASLRELDRASALLADCEKLAEMRLDGELLFADESGRTVGVSWREWSRCAKAKGGVGQVLVKTLFGPELRPFHRLRSSLRRKGERGGRS